MYVFCKGEALLCAELSKCDTSHCPFGDPRHNSIHLVTLTCRPVAFSFFPFGYFFCKWQNILPAYTGLIPPPMHKVNGTYWYWDHLPSYTQHKPVLLIVTPVTLCWNSLCVCFNYYFFWSTNIYSLFLNSLSCIVLLFITQIDQSMADSGPSNRRRSLSSSPPVAVCHPANLKELHTEMMAFQNLTKDFKLEH
jgi:hypothetical protein